MKDEGLWSYDRNSEPTWIDVFELGAKVRVSNDYVVLADHWVPRWLEIKVGGSGEPETYARVEIESDVPTVVELRFTSIDPESRGVRQQDLRDVQIQALSEDFVAMFTNRVERLPGGGGIVVPPLAERDYENALRFVGKLRSRNREITPQLLEDVARVYRRNIKKAPTKAVEHHFQVSQRMAAEYVSRARKRGLLPTTKRGKKLA